MGRSQLGRSRKPRRPLRWLICPFTGTWQSRINLPFAHIVPLPREYPITPEQAATLSINPPTALRLLSGFVQLDPAGGADHGGRKQWVIQNGANSAVGVAVIQIAKSWGVARPKSVRVLHSAAFEFLLTSSLTEMITRPSNRTSLHSAPITSSRTKSSSPARLDNR